MAEYEETNPSTNPRSRRIFDIGDDIEYRGNKWLKSWGYTIFGRNYRLEGTNPERTGKIDGFIVLNNFVYPYDWKSAADFTFKKWINAAGLTTTTNQAKDSGYVAYHPDEVANPSHCPVKEYSLEYYYQAQDYMDSLQKVKHTFPFQLGDGFIFLVCNKNDGFLYEEFVKYNPEAISERLLTLDKGYGIIASGDTCKPFKKPTKTLAKKIREVREYTDKSKRPCNWCGYLDLCWETKK